MNLRAGLLALTGGLALVLLACGGDSGDSGATRSQPSTAPPTSPAGVATRAGVERCLREAGLDVVTGSNVPIISGVRAIGLRLPGGDGLEPGKLSAAVFVYRSSAEAASAKQGLAGTAFGDIVQAGNVMTVYAGRPPASARAKIEGCTAKQD